MTSQEQQDRERLNTELETAIREAKAAARVWLAAARAEDRDRQASKR